MTLENISVCMISSYIAIPPFARCHSYYTKKYRFCQETRIRFAKIVRANVQKSALLRHGARDVSGFFVFARPFVSLSVSRFFLTYFQKCVIIISKEL
jgi:hypothetical protein